MSETYELKSQLDTSRCWAVKLYVSTWSQHKLFCLHVAFRRPLPTALRL